MPNALSRTSKDNDSYIFHKVYRHGELELDIVHELSDLGMNLQNGRMTMSRGEAFGWMQACRKAI